MGHALMAMQPHPQLRVCCPDCIIISGFPQCSCLPSSPCLCAGEEEADADLADMIRKGQVRWQPPAQPPQAVPSRPTKAETGEA